MRPPTANTPVGILVAERTSRAEVFDRYGIDYCCGGKLPVRWFCEKKGLDLAAVLAALDAADEAPEAEPAPDWTRASLAQVVTHVVSTHHAYLRTTLPRLAELLAKVARPHDAAYTVLAELEPVFARFQAEMAAHMDQEEQVVFPLIIKLERGLADRALGERFLTQQLARMDREHHGAGRDLDVMASLTQGFTQTGAAGDCHRALLVGLSEVFADTHRHVHLENSILFPRAAQLRERPRRALLR